MYHVASVTHLSQSVIVRFIFAFLFFAPSAFARDGVEMHFRGIINSRTVIYMRLMQTNDDSVHGDYMYLTSGKTVPLRGTIKNGKCNITQFSDAGKPSGTFIGGFKEVEFTGGLKEVMLNGMWLSRDSSTFFRFELTRSGPVIETVKTHKSILLPSDSSIVIEAFAPKIRGCDDEKTQKINTYLDSAMSEYSSQDNSTQMNRVQGNKYDIHYITDNILSISSGGLDNNGGAHPNPHSTSVTLNLQTGKPLRIKDIFKAAAVKKINALFAADVHKYTDCEESRICVKIDPSSTNFTVDAYQMKFDFIKYAPTLEVGCSVVSIPLKDLVEYIDPKGPFKIFLVLW